MTELKEYSVIAYLRDNRQGICDYLRRIVVGKDFNYRTFGTAVEEHLSDALVKFLTDGKFILGNSDFELAPNKNCFPDFILNSSPRIAIEYKSGNTSQFRDGKWIKVKNSENDMGTLNEWPKKIEKFGGGNIFYVFVIYNFDENSQEIIDVRIDPFYKFIGLNSGGMLKYREKDGNLRPKNFEAEPPIKNFDQFAKLLSKTIIYRSRRIIIKHKKIIKVAKDISV